MLGTGCNIICKKNNIQHIPMEQQNMRRETPKIIPLFKQRNVHLPLQGGNLQQRKTLL
jgi:hypothetical protein